MEPSLPRPIGGFTTRAVAGTATSALPEQHPVSAGIWLSSTWGVQRSAEIGRLLTDEQAGYVYGRYDNPTATTLHGVVASLHGSPGAWSLASGTAAVHATVDVLRGEGTVLASDRLYGGTWALFERLGRTSGWRVDHAPLSSARHLDAALRPEHSVVYVETLANPSMEVADLPAVAEACRRRGVALVVDNTFASPWLCRPYELGATAVIESATKFLGGHGDVVAGVVAADADLVEDVRRHTYELGASLGAFEAWLVLRGLQTLALRLQRGSASALQLASALHADARVERVRYPGLPDHPQHDLAAELFAGRGFGALLAFDLPTREQAEAFADACRVLVRASSLGGTHSLVIHPASTSHRQLDERALAAAGIGPGTVRLSIGIEDVEDLLADVLGAVAAAVGQPAAAEGPST